MLDLEMTMQTATADQKKINPRENLALGAMYLGDGRCSFRVWAPKAKRVEVVITHPAQRDERMQPDSNGYQTAILEDVFPGTRYVYRINGELERPDPVSRYQPETVHGPSEVVDPDFQWEEGDWKGRPLKEFIFYELHVGTATPDGTFDAIIPRLSHLTELGVTALEIMPVAQFPGTRNWGYDGVSLFAVQNSYGGPAGLKRLVNACHQAGLAVVLDVVYNHLGPEGNYLRDFGPYFTSKYKTPWGDALNFDGPHSNEVRRFFIENALQWQTEFRIDALRLDAVHAIQDFSAVPFLQELARATGKQAAKLGRPFYLIAESDLNDPRLIRDERSGGYGLDAQWSDDFHHVLHVLLTGERAGYYQDFGGVEQLGKVFRHGYVYTGEYCSSRKRNHGSPPERTSAKQFVVYSQNHDQIGNRMLGERLSGLVGFEKLKVAAGTVLLSPFLPLLFMGEEYGEMAPFRYVVSHQDPDLLEAVRQGRKVEFAEFDWQHEVPDPGSVSTFEECFLRRDASDLKDWQKQLQAFYRELIRLRREVQVIWEADKDTITVESDEELRTLLVFYGGAEHPVCMAVNFSDEAACVQLPPGSWSRLLDSTDKQWGGGGGSIPDSLICAGPSTLRLQPTSLALLRQTT